MRGCLRQKWPDHHGAGHLRAQICEDDSGENVRTTSAQGISEPRLARLSRAKAAEPPWGRASSRSELRGCLWRKWPDHLGSGHLGTQISDDVIGEKGLTTIGQGNSEVRDARISQAHVSSPPQLSASRYLESRGCPRTKWPDHHGAWYLLGLNCEDVSGESGLTTPAQGISELRVARMSQAKAAGPPWSRATPRSKLRGCLRRKCPDHLSSNHLGTQTCKAGSGESRRPQ